MSARHHIIKAVADNKPAFVPLPDINLDQVTGYDDLAAQFATVVQSIGGQVVPVPGWEALKPLPQAERAAGKWVVNAVPELGATDQEVSSMDAVQLAGVDMAFVPGTLGVAENGAVWLYESQMINRLLPFICQQLVLVLERKALVATMHQALLQVDTAREGYGVFIAGPSKTADIEQSLVIGAHGPVGLTVYLIG
ncbi:MAG: LUD domain-containing protein [Chitinophagaceae bacterium]|nr:LUD domain-containing protein [Chitinophagaceae bacterium]